MSEYKFSCPYCGQHFQCDESWNGRKLDCPFCQKEITINLNVGFEKTETEEYCEKLSQDCMREILENEKSGKNHYQKRKSLENIKKKYLDDLQRLIKTGNSEKDLKKIRSQIKKYATYSENRIVFGEVKRKIPHIFIFSIVIWCICACFAQCSKDTTNEQQEVEDAAKIILIETAKKRGMDTSGMSWSYRTEHAVITGNKAYVHANFQYHGKKYLYSIELVRESNTWKVGGQVLLTED